MILTINKLADLILSFNPQEAGDVGHGAGKKVQTLLQTRSGTSSVQVRARRSVTTCSPNTVRLRNFLVEAGWRCSSGREAVLERRTTEQ
jgi:hypothetical protein